MHNTSINYYGYFTPFGGYGIANFNWVKHLRRKGLDIIPHGKFMPKPGEKEYEVLNAEEKEIASIPFTRQEVGIIETTPFDFKLLDTVVKIANTMVESDEIGKPWIKECKRMDYIIVPNEFQKKVFENANLKVPIVVIPHGTETEKFPYFDRPEREVFTFGIAGWLDNRKGVFDVIQAFASEFDNNEPVALKLHSSNPAFGYYKFYQDERISMDTKLLSPEDLNLWYQSLDCFVFPSKAEGIGQPPREAMATGLPVIVGNYSGLEDIALEGITFPMNPIGFTTREEFPEQPGRWAKYDIQELMGNMRHIYEHKKRAKQVGVRAAAYIRGCFSWEKAADEMIYFLTHL